MPAIVGTLIPPQLAAAPSSPVDGQLYFDTALDKLFWWSGSAWVPATGAAEVYEQPAAPASPSVGALWIDTDDVAPTYQGNPLVTTLPSNPVDGQEVHYLVDATNGVVWRLKYRQASSSAYKWEFAGGSPLDSGFNIADDNGGNSTSYIDFANNPGPSLTIPRAGDYMVSFGAMGYSTVVSELWVSMKRGAAATSDNDAATAWEAVAVHLITLQRDIRMSGLAANDVLKMQHRTSVAGAASYRQRWLNVTPVRVS